MARVIVFALCVLFILSIFVAMLMSIWSTREQRRARLRSELVWASIPCLMIIAAAIPVGVAILAPSSAAPHAPAPVCVPARGFARTDHLGTHARVEPGKMAIIEPPDLPTQR